jgi:hypothetical protein
MIVDDTVPVPLVARMRIFKSSPLHTVRTALSCNLNLALVETKVFKYKVASKIVVSLRPRELIPRSH